WPKILARHGQGLREEVFPAGQTAALTGSSDCFPGGDRRPWPSARMKKPCPMASVQKEARRPTMPDDPHDLARFVEAQACDYDQALAEIKAGRKRSHWMW